MTDRSALTLALLAALAGATTTARAADPPTPPATSGPSTAPAPATPAPATPPAAAPAAGAGTSPATAPAAPEPSSKPPAKPATNRDADADSDDDSDESPAIAPPDTSPSAIFTARKHHAPAIDFASHAPDDGLMGTHQAHWIMSLGVRDNFVTHPGFDLFAPDNQLPQVSLDAGHTLFTSGALSFAGLLLFDWGGMSASARGTPTSLSATRLTVGAEGRYHLLRRLYGFGRIAPGLLVWNATIKDRVAGVDSKASAATFATDLSLGAAVECFGESRGASNRPRGWIRVEGGYGWAPSAKLTFKPESTDGAPSGAPVRLEPLALGDLAVRGGFFRMSAMVTY